MKQCSMCNATKSLDAFHRQPTGKHGRHSYCSDCSNALRRVTRPTTGDARGYTPDKMKRWQLKSRYGLTPTQYEEKLDAQGGNCAICGEKPERPCVDHNHRTNAVRGVLCHRCNIGLPYVENATYRAKALAYLITHSKDETAV